MPGCTHLREPRRLPVNFSWLRLGRCTPGAQEEELAGPGTTYLPASCPGQKPLFMWPRDCQALKGPFLGP